MKLGDLLRARAQEGDGQTVSSGPSEAAEPSGRSVNVQMVPVSAIEVSPFYPRTRYEGPPPSGLVSSISAHGLLQPIIVRPKGEQYELLSGLRRMRACQSLGWATVPAMVKKMDDLEAAAFVTTENLPYLRRRPMEEAQSYRRLLEAFNLTPLQLAQQLGCPSERIRCALRLLDLPSSVQEQIASGTLGEGHVSALLKLSSAEEQERLASWAAREQVTVRQLEERVTAVIEGRSEETPARRRVSGLPKELRLFFGGLQALVENLRTSGWPVSVERARTGGAWEVRLRIPGSKR